jgi:cobalt-zinc-cadmium efflux system membrane fusion protein
MDRDERAIEEGAPTRAGRGGGAARWVLRGLLGLMLILIGVAGGVLWGERRASWSPAGSGSEPRTGAVAKRGDELPARQQPAAGDTTIQENEPVEVSLTAEAVERAGIKTAPVRSETAVTTITVPGTVTSNAYRDTKVNALVGGIVRRVGVELGQPVSRGQVLAVVFSNELADAQMKYLSMRAMFTADHQKIERTEQLASIGAASRQELEEVTATHHAHETELAAGRQRLFLLGLTAEEVDALRDASQVVSEVMVTAPSDGMILMRTVNPGQVVGAGQELFTVTDLSTVWVIGDLYEKDFASTRVGSEATVTVAAAPRDALRGRVTYIDPRVDPATRTAKVRVEVPNRDGDLRLGMYVSVSFQAAAGERRTLVPKSAVQMLGERAVVYVPAADGEYRFMERPIRLGPTVGDLVQVLEGVKPGERVVTEGSFLLRAEAARTRSGG